MKAIGLNKFGNADVLEEMEFRDPKAGDNEVVIRTAYTSVNRLDILVRAGYMGSTLKTPAVPGADVVGTIESMGSEVIDFSVSDLVIAHTVLGCGRCRFCLSGNENLCENYRIVGRNVFGAYGELVKLPASALIKPPEYLNKEELACLPLSLPTAWRSLDVLAKAQEGNSIVIRGASGNVGILMVLLSKAMGLNVVALTRSKEKGHRLKELGADLVIDTSENADIIKDVRDFTEGRGADFVIEPFGSTLEQSIEITRNGGKIILFGTITGSTASFDVKKLYLKSKSVIGTMVSSKYEFEEALNMLESKRIRPIIGNRFSIRDAQKAHTLLESSDNFGKIIMRHDW